MCRVRLPLDYLAFLTSLRSGYPDILIYQKPLYLVPPGNIAFIIFGTSGSPLPPAPLQLSSSCSVFLFEAKYRAPRPIIIILPVWLFMSCCNNNAASTHHFTIPVPSDSKVSTRSLVPLRYFSMRNNFLSSYLLGSLTRVVRKVTPVRISSRTRLHRKSNFSTVVWNAWAAFSLNLRTISLTL